MSIEYKELTTIQDFDQCIELQRSIFGLTDFELISPLFLKLIFRNNPPIGISLGMFLVSQFEKELVGFIIGFATFIENSIYVTLGGIKTEHQRKGYGYNLFLKFREFSLEKQIGCMYCIFDPLESHLSRLYFSSLGFIGIKYEEEAYILSNIDTKKYVPADSLLIRWDFKSESTLKKLSGFKTPVTQELLQNIPIATDIYMPESPNILVEIPGNFIQMKNDDIESARKWRESTRNIFAEYINNRHYIVSDCYSFNQEDTRKTYYLLEEKQ